MADVSERLRRRIARDFAPGAAEEVVRALSELPYDALGGQDGERVLTAIVLSSQGELPRFEAALALLRLDWRDVLVAGGLANGDWPVRLEIALEDDGRAGRRA